MQRRYFKTFQGRMISSFMVAIFITFLVLTAVFYQQLTQSLRESRARQLDSIAAQLDDVIVNYARNPEGLNQSIIQLDDYLDFVHQSFGAYVWLVTDNGTIAYSNGVPGEARGQLLNVADYPGPPYDDLPADWLNSLPMEQRPRIPAAYLNYTDSGAYTPGKDNAGYVFTGGNFLGLFARQPGFSWISIVRPLSADTPLRNVTLHLHERYELDRVARTLMLNSMGLAVIIAMLIGLVIILVFSRSITQPIRALSEAASKVAAGDLSVRIEYPEKRNNDDLPELTEFDELTGLVHTFNRMVDHLEHTSSTQRDFVSSISHDLRTPLTSISGFVEGMLDGTIPPERHEHYLQIVKQETLRLRELVNDMNDANQLDQGTVNYNFRPFDLNVVIASVISGLESLISGKRITVQTSQAEDHAKPLMVIGDEAQISRVLYNLVSNAVKFTPVDGVIAVTTRKLYGGRQALVKVEDSGSGISEQDLPHIFDRFYRGDKSRTGHHGSGLGLYIARSVILDHGQKINAGNSKMGGAEFSFTLQLDQPGKFRKE